MLPQADNSSWNRAAAAHLLNRGGFGGTPNEIDLVYKQGRKATIRALLTPPAPMPEPVLASSQSMMEMAKTLAGMTQEERREAFKAAQRKGIDDLLNLRSLWIQQMMRPEAAGLEKAVLFWHGHFATSVQKVKNPGLMWKQNKLFRQFAFGDYRDMVKAISCDPAMVLWLDLQQSSGGAPNENFARELMELFTLGIGNYTEDDIKASARAFTGYRTGRMDGTFDYVEQRHDSGEKVFMGKKGPFSGDDIIDIIFQQPACAEYICAKLWTFYAYEDPEPVIVKTLAQTFRKSNYQLKQVFEEMWGSTAFYSPKAVGTQIKSPTQFIVQTCNTLECNPPTKFLLQQSMKGLGQMLFAPPNVKGWDGNRAWINTATLAARMEFTDALLGIGSQSQFMKVEVPLEKLVTNEMINHPAMLVDGITARLLSVGLDQNTRSDLIAEAEKYDKPLSRTATREILARILRLPEYQLV